MDGGDWHPGIEKERGPQEDLALPSDKLEPNFQGGEPILSAVHSIVQDILSKRSDLSEDQILAMIEEKKKEGRGLLSDEGAARLVTDELLIQTRGTELGRMQVKDLVSGLNDVSISGRVLLAWPPQQFQRRDGTPGRVLRLVLVDRSGRVRCALWDRHVDVLSRAGNLRGRILRIGHAYTRQGLAGDTEIHGGERSSIEIDPQEMPTSDFPEFSELFTPLSKLAADAYQVNAVGLIQAEPRHYTFAKEERTGSVLRTLIADETGTIPLVAWNERAEELKEIKKGEIIQVLNARTRLDQNGRPELHVESRSQVEILETPPDYLKMPVAKVYKIADLTGQVSSVDLSVVVLVKGQPQEVKRTTGEPVKVARLIVADETGIVSLSLWDDKAEFVDQLSEGEGIDLRGISIRERVGEISLSLGRSGELQKGMAKAHVRQATKLNSLQNAKGLLIVEGTVSDQPVARQVATDKGETINLASFNLRDDTGSAKATFWRDQVDSVTKLRTGMRVRITGLRVRAGLGGELELSSIPATGIEMIDQPANERPAWEDIRHVISLEPGLTTWVKGVILEALDKPKLKVLCETCNAPLRVSDMNLVCQNCKATKVGRVKFAGRFKIDDGTGVAEVTILDLDPAQFVSTDLAGVRERMLVDGKAELVLDREEFAKTIGKEVEIYGTAEPSGTQAKFEIKTKKVLVVGKL
jgi:replication factor A1